MCRKYHKEQMDRDNIIKRTLPWIFVILSFVFLALAEIKYDYIFIKTLHKAGKLKYTAQALLWRHNDRDGVSNHQPHDCLLNRLFWRRSKKASKLRVNGLCAANSPVTGESPHKGPVTRKMSPFDDVIMKNLLGILNSMKYAHSFAVLFFVLVLVFISSFQIFINPYSSEQLH